MRVFCPSLFAVFFTFLLSESTAQVNCPTTAPTAPLLDCVSVSTNLCPGQIAILPALTTTPELPDIEFVVTRVGALASDGLGDEILGSTTSFTIDPITYGLAPGEQFDVTPVAYNRTSVQTLIDNIYNNTSGLFTCCFIVGLLAPDFCPNLMSAGINSGSDIQTIADVVTVLSNLSGMAGTTTSVPGLLASIDGLNMQATGTLPPACGGDLLPLCYAVGQGGGVCRYTLLQGIDPSCLLPLELSEFSGVALPLYNELRWTTETEVNSAFFSVERSADGSNFMEIGQEVAAGASDSPANYAFADNNPLTDLNYYRLAQIGFDGSVSYSEIVLVERDDPDGFEVVSVGPIPNRGLLTIGIASNSEEQILLNFTDIAGRKHKQKMYSVAEGLNSYQLDTSRLTDGMYLLTLIKTSTGEQFHVKFIKHLN